MTLFENLCASSLDITALGFVPDEKLGSTPDGKITFHQDGMIFANGMPVAKDFSDFLGLLCCVDADFLALAPHCPRLRFQRELARRSVSRKRQMVRNALKNYFHVPDIQDPYGYIRSLQDKPQPSKSTLGASTPFGKTLWHANSAEILNDRIAVQICVEIFGQDVLSFYDRWEDVRPNEEQKLLMEAQNPFAIHGDITATVNGASLIPAVVEKACWNPLTDNTAEAENLLHRCGLDMEQGWVFLKLHIPYQSKKKKRVRSLSLQLEPKAITVPGPRLTTPMLRDTVSIPHPITGEAYTLTVHSCTQEGLDPNFLTNPPCFYTRLCYDMTPALGEDVFQIFDSQPNDPLLPPPGASAPYPDPELENAPTAELVEIDEGLPTHIRTAFSARHYKETPKVNWMTRFRYTPGSSAVLPIVR